MRDRKGHAAEQAAGLAFEEPSASLGSSAATTGGCHTWNNPHHHPDPGPDRRVAAVGLQLGLGLLSLGRRGLSTVDRDYPAAAQGDLRGDGRTTRGD
jgi:hypothetical protein